jgi:hypothetical protein
LWLVLSRVVFPTAVPNAGAGYKAQ